MNNKIVYIVLGVFVVCVLVFTTAFYVTSSIDSDDKVISELNEEGSSFGVMNTEYEGIAYRYAVDTESFDPSVPTITFIHGAIGSLTNFNDYLHDPVLSSEANLVVFDRPNYGPVYNENYVHEIAFEAELVNDLHNKYRSEAKNILVGYSYGGPIALKAYSIESYDTVILLAPAVDPNLEIEPWLLWVYESDFTRWLVPRIWKEASKEKLDHVRQLEMNMDMYGEIEGDIVHLHGTSDRVVPYGNVDFLSQMIPDNTYTHIPFEGAMHSFIWGSSQEILEIIQSVLYE